MAASDDKAPRTAGKWSPAASILWRLVRVELQEWSRRGHSPILWWRDDDARVPSPALDRLIALSRLHRAPLALAIVPDVDLSAIARRIQDEALVHPIQHGCDHVDRGRPAGASAEFNPDAPPAEVAAAINAAWGRLSGSTKAAPIYAPPWNVLTPNVSAALRQTPLEAVSLYGLQPAKDVDLPQVNTHLDVMKWRPARFRGAGAILRRLWRQLRARRATGAFSTPIGLLTHHRNLDEDAWSFAAAFLARLGPAQALADWPSLADLIVGARRAQGARG